MSSEGLKVLLIGNGGREHVLAWKLAQSEKVSHIFCAPGNGGTAQESKCSNLSTPSADDFAGLVKFAQDNAIGLVVPGPEAPLVAGATDFFLEHIPGIKVFGPSKAAAALEGSKTFSKDFMDRHNVPTARYGNFTSYEEAAKHLDEVDYKVVVKADGLAAGKGVLIPQTKVEALDALKSIMQTREFGDAGNSVVIEEFLEGDEISILTFCDGKTSTSLPPAQDHKRIFDNDQGPNTGGMGTYAPAPVATDALVAQIEKEVLQPTLDGCAAEGYPFKGILFTGLMLTKAGPRVLEYNVRFGDPEAQSCLPLMNNDLAELMLACCDGNLEQQKLSLKEESACTVVVAAGGYPASYTKGTSMEIESTDEEGNHVFHAGTALKDENLVTSGGRVIAASATAKSLREAVDKAYRGVNRIKFEGMQYRRDIAARALR
ncbi:phosphoribosylamine-glycine ligase [Polychaeton citri CBS 116435]|uniref:phosphoribosylamine--glycine ligase n=1 Tax=Polychaeton citri CBS 116435 TaxID=1314669 RepID=A0A9P4Q708_9PEZI|nr:phosphoribosylamine-glycine ligase [Polychaeton citri CBS 116435]